MAHYKTIAFFAYDRKYETWSPPGSEVTELGALIEPEVGQGEAEVYVVVQA
jgi:hypothetical protein